MVNTFSIVIGKIPSVIGFVVVKITVFTDKSEKSKI